MLIGASRGGPEDPHLRHDANSPESPRYATRAATVAPSPTIEPAGVPPRCSARQAHKLARAAVYQVSGGRTIKTSAWCRRLVARRAALVLALLLLGCRNDADTTQPRPRPDEPTASVTAPTPRTATSAPRTATSAPRTPTSPPRPPHPGCPPGDPLAGVSSPNRLILKAACVRVSGIVGCVKTNKEDGDTHLGLLLDKGQSKYLRPANRLWACKSDQGSDSAPRIHVEVLPQHCRILFANCADEYPYTNPKIPKNGEHVVVTGAWVLDRAHNRGFTRWAEIHPAFRIDVKR
jgi:hypothetical protein